MGTTTASGSREASQVKRRPSALETLIRQIDAIDGAAFGKVDALLDAIATNAQTVRNQHDDLVAALRHAHEALTWHGGLGFSLNVDGPTAGECIVAALSKAGAGQ